MKKCRRMVLGVIGSSLLLTHTEIKECPLNLTVIPIVVSYLPFTHDI